MADKVKINGNDFFETYGGLLETGAYQELMKPFGAWPEEERQIALPVAIMGDGEVDFWGNYNAFLAVLKTGADIILEVQALHRRFKLGYASVSNFKMLSKVQGAGRMGAQMVLNLTDDYPNTFTSVRTQDFIPQNGIGSVTFTRTYTSFSQADADLLKLEDATFLTDGQNFANGYVSNYPPVPVLPTYYGPAAAIPTTAAAVKGLPGLLGQGIMSFDIATGLNRIVVVAVPVSKSVQSVYDATSQEALTPSFALRSQITIDGQGYKIYALHNLIAFSSSHTLNIVLKNG